MEKSGFRRLYDALPERSQEVGAPKADFVRMVAIVTKKRPATVRAWLYGVQKPDALTLSVLSQKLGVPADELF
ncbi:MAG: XRE family transcriptional regulator [Bacteroidaceae bacterium]|nr:XRE family transcriptional regulator [Bacteroidaceae bacterium]